MGYIRIIEFAALQVLKTLFFLLPRKTCLAIGKVLGLLVFHLDRKHRRLALDNLELAFGSEKPFSALYEIARASFIHFGRVTADILKCFQISSRKKANLIRAQGEENLRRALEGGKGALIFTAHFGNWEIASAAVSKIGRLHVIARPLDNPLLERALAAFRERLGAKVIHKYQAAKKILLALNRNEMVAILIDQNVLRNQAVFVDFFGRAAATTPGLASFALRTGASLVPVFCYPEPDFSYRLEISEPLQIPLSGVFEQDVLKITRTCTKIIESRVRENPGFWLWFHNRWKTRPEGEIPAERCRKSNLGLREEN